MNRRTAHSTTKSPALTPDADDGWWTQALCAQTDPEAFFPDKGEGHAYETTRAKEICRRCPVAAQCFAWALENEPEFGIYGGMTAREIARSRKRKA